MASITVIATNVYNDAAALQTDLNKVLTELKPEKPKGRLAKRYC